MSDYRKVLHRFIGKNIVLECSDFSLSHPRPDGRWFVLLRAPTICHIDGTTIRGDIPGHIWVETDDTFIRYSQLARRIRISGRITPYRYRAGGKNIGIKANSVSIRKYRKDIAKEWGLNPGQLLSHKQMDKIIRSNQ